MPDSTQTNHVLLLGGRSGVGKTSVGAEASELLQAAGVAHCLIEGDNLDAAYPKAADDPHGTALTEANLRALWQNYAAIGHTRAIYVNTVSVLEAPMVLRALGGGRSTGVLLTGADEVLVGRLGGREIGRVLSVNCSEAPLWLGTCRRRRGQTWCAFAPMSGMPPPLPRRFCSCADGFPPLTDGA